MNPQSLDRANAFLASVASRTEVGEVLPGTPADIGHELAFPDALSTARAVRALIARRRLEPADGSYRLLDARPVDAGEREVLGRRPRKPRESATSPAGRGGASSSSSAPMYSDVGRAAVDRLVEMGREVASLRASLRSAREEARASREARVGAEQRAEVLGAKVRELEARAEMAEANLRTLLASVRGREAQRDAPVGDSEMEAILGVLKGGEDADEEVAASPAAGD
ncbi:MAG: hypothetical protein ACXWYW_14015 [Actinomycetota bacterium]